VAETPDEWATAVDRLAGDPAGAVAQAERALDLVRVRYSWDGKAREYEAVLAEAVAAAAAGASVPGGAA
jgi:hypothetical protein